MSSIVTMKTDLKLLIAILKKFSSKLSNIFQKIVISPTQQKYRINVLYKYGQLFITYVCTFYNPNDMVIRSLTK